MVLLISGVVVADKFNKKKTNGIFLAPNCTAGNTSAAWFSDNQTYAELDAAAECRGNYSGCFFWVERYVYKKNAAGVYVPFGSNPWYSHSASAQCGGIWTDNWIIYFAGGTLFGNSDYCIRTIVYENLNVIIDGKCFFHVP